MLITRFWDIREYVKYRDWLYQLDSDSLYTYFGYTINEQLIDNLVENIVSHSNKHYFLVAERNGVIVGVLHLAECNRNELEFGITVSKHHRRNGIADALFSYAFKWASNRNYNSVYVYYSSKNKPIRQLCIKHHSIVKSHYGSNEAKIKLLPRNIFTVVEEFLVESKNLYYQFLQKQIEILGINYLVKT